MTTPSTRTGDPAEPLTRQEPASPVPDHAHTVVVPVANPDTAAEMLDLARAVVQTNGGRVIALAVVLGEADAEDSHERIEALREIVDTVRARDGQERVELMTRPAVSIARGILDTCRDEGADLVIVGVQAPTAGGIALGGVAERVMRAADCDVLVYRRGQADEDLGSMREVVVGVDGSADARTAARLGIILGQGLGLPVEMLHVRVPGETAEAAAITLDEAISGLDGEASCGRRTVLASSPVQGLRASIGRRTLTVVGFDVGGASRDDSIGSTTQGALDTLRGPVLAVSRPARSMGVADLLRHATRRLRPRLTDAEEQSLVWHARVDATLSTDFVVLCVAAAAIATFGLLLNSPAVIIGAMLVAPLMSPIVAFGTSLVDGDVITLRRAAGTTGIGAVLVALTAVALGVVFGGDPPTQEMLSRGSPSLIDAGVAGASGLIGGYASARKGIPAALAGVAIAAALVPPICVFGLALSIDGRLAAGSGLLFVTNIACIAAASAGTLLWLGVHVRSTGAARKRYITLVGPVLGVVLAALVLFGLSGRGPNLGLVQDAVEEAMPDMEVVAVDTLGPPDSVTVTVRSVAPPDRGAVTRATAAVAEVTGGLVLRVAHQQVVAGP